MKRREMLASLLGGAWLAGMADAAQRRPVVAGIDHIVVLQRNPAELFTLFAQAFQLPVIWPMAEFGSSASGGLHFGNVVVEFARSDRLADGSGARIGGIAFRPFESAAASIAELDARGIKHGAAQPYIPGGEGPQQALWTTVQVDEVAPPGVAAFVCEYHFDTATGLRKADQALATSRGGPLGLAGATELAIESPGPDAAAGRWRALLAPAPEPVAGRFALPPGPTIALVRGPSDAIGRLTLAVASLDRARAFLEQRAIAHRGESDGVLIDGGALGGLALRLVTGVA